MTSGLLKETEGRIRMRPYANGIIGTLPGYPVYDQLADLAPSFKDRQQAWYSGYREKFELDLTAEGEIIPCIVKAKVESDDSALVKYRADFARYRHWRERLKEVKPDSPNGNWLKDRIRDFSKEVLFNSVIRELVMAEEAAQRYQKVYGEPLNIERGVGFIIDRNGRKWSVYRQIPDVIRFSKLPVPDAVKVESRAEEYLRLMIGRLQGIGIRSQDLVDRKMANLVITGNSSDVDTLNFVLVDTEDWLIAA